MRTGNRQSVILGSGLIANFSFIVAQSFILRVELYGMADFGMDFNFFKKDIIFTTLVAHHTVSDIPELL